MTSNKWFKANRLPLAAQSKASVCGRSLAETMGSNPFSDMDACRLCVLSYQVEVTALGLSFVQRSTTDCGVPECDREASIMRRPRPAVCAL